MMVNFKKSFKSIYNKLLYSRYNFLYKKQFKSYLQKCSYANVERIGEKAWVDLWGTFNCRVERNSFRFFSHFLDSPLDIVPEAVGRCFIEPILNPMCYRECYADKNFFPIICGKENVVPTLACRVNGGLILDSEYRPICDLYSILESYNSLILKPSTGSSSGLGVLRFSRNVKTNWKWVSSNGETLSESFLYDYSKNFVLQPAINQHPNMAILNKTSVNTIRIAVYRSIKDETPHVIASIVRIGKEGSYVDNAHAGGLFAGVDLTTGRIGSQLFDQYGNTFTNWNGVDYSSTALYIPQWEKVKKMCEKVAIKLVHNRLIAFDIAVTDENDPVIIEYNIKMFSYWLFMYTNQKPLGEYTQEIINYCKAWRE